MRRYLQILRKNEGSLIFCDLPYGANGNMSEKNNFRHAEKCLYEYKRNLACIDILKEDLRVLKATTDVNAQNYDKPFTKNNSPSDPVAQHLIKLEQIEVRIKLLERWTKPIERLIADLSSDVLDGSKKKGLLQVLKLFYFGNNVPDPVMEELNISRRAFFRKRRELVLMAIDYLGF